MPKADIDALIEALTSSLDSIVQYYDRETGEVVAISDEFGTGGLEGPPERYLVITPLSVSERYQIMEDFVETLGNESLQDELNEALIEKGAFLKFEQTLKKYPTRNQQWQNFRNDKMRAHCRAWMREHGIE
jgi:hypothetical protein